MERVPMMPPLFHTSPSRAANQSAFSTTEGGDERHFYLRCESFIKKSETKIAMVSFFNQMLVKRLTRMFHVFPPHESLRGNEGDLQVHDDQKFKKIKKGQRRALSPLKFVVLISLLLPSFGLPTVHAQVAGITVNPTSGLTTTEGGGTATFTVVLDTLPTGDVSIALSSSDTTEGTVSPASLTFTTSNGTIPQTVTVTGVDDAMIDGSIAYFILTGAATSDDFDYAGLDPADVSVTNTDNDVAGITVNPTSGLTT
ncbi:MAG TPA: hypothetical protein DD706_19245, partial [Nitrospiraceae bacterium]|nr:hypothetical protein [Nitrospiraceae bacterium]